MVINTLHHIFKFEKNRACYIPRSKLLTADIIGAHG